MSIVFQTFFTEKMVKFSNLFHHFSGLLGLQPGLYLSRYPSSALSDTFLGHFETFWAESNGSDQGFLLVLLI
jgi:hypothetical protein